MALGRTAHPVSIAEKQLHVEANASIGNTVFEPGKEGSHYKGSGSGSGDKEEEKKDDGKEGKSEEGKS